MSATAMSLPPAAPVRGVMPHGALLRCAVCDAPVPRGLAARTAPGDPFPACEAVACRMVVSRRAGMHEAGFRHFLQLHAWQVRQRAAAAREAQARQDAQAQENVAAWAALAQRLPAGGPAPLQLLLPSGPRRQAVVSATRLAQYRAHLVQLAREAGALPAGPVPVENALVDAAPAQIPMLAGQLCGACGGGCCTRGGNHAYLGAPALRKFLDAHPDATTEDAVQAYLAHVPARAQAGSCINHTRGGCSLPRAMRSETCNRFACASLGSLQAAERDAAGTPMPQPVLVVRRKQDHWRRMETGPANAIAATLVLAHAPG